MGHYRKGPLYDRLNVHPLSTKYLMPSLIRFFIGESLTFLRAISHEADVESTGGHTQFWGELLPVASLTS